MATNSVRRIFMDATREQHKIVAAAASNQNCPCNSWSSASSANPPVTMMARYVREEDKSVSWLGGNDKKTS